MIFRQYPVAVLCPQAQDLKCSNVFFVQNGQVDFVATIPDLKFFFATELGPLPSEDGAIDAASTWLRFSEELKQGSVLRILRARHLLHASGRCD